MPKTLPMIRRSIAILFAMAWLGCAAEKPPEAPPPVQRERPAPPPVKIEAAAQPVPPAPPPAPACQNDPGATVATPLTVQEARVMVAALPLDPEDIDFHRIANFFNLYRHVVETHHDPRKCEVLRAIEQVTGWMSNAASLTRSGQSTFSMHASPDDVKNWLAPPALLKYMVFLDNIDGVVQFTGNVVNLFYATYVHPNPSVFRELEVSQIEAQSRGGNSYAMRNREIIRGLQADGPKIVR